MQTTWGEGDKIFVLQVGATFSSEDEPQESATISSTVRLYLVNGKAVFVNCRYGCYQKQDGFLFINGTAIRSLSKAVLRVNYGNGGRVVCSSTVWNRHFILTGTVIGL